MTYEEFKKQLEIDRESTWYKISYPLYRTFYWLCDFRYHLRCIRWYFVRGWRGWAECDMWSFDSYLTSWVGDALRHLNKHRNGCYPSYLASEEEWTEIIEKIAIGFDIPAIQDELTLEEGGYEEYKKKWDELEERRIEGMTLFVKHYHGLWD